MFKKLKYNIIFVLVVAIVTGSVLFNLFFNKEEAPVYTPPASSDDLFPDGGDIFPSDENPGDDIQEGEDGKNTEDKTENKQEEIDPNVPSIRNPVKLANYAFDKTLNAKSYKNVLYVEMTNLAPLGVTNYQHMKGEINKNGNASTEVSKFYADGAFKDSAANYTRYFYRKEDGSIEYGITPDGNFDIQNANVKNLTREEYYNQFYTSPQDVPAVSITIDKVQATGETMESRGKKYYYVKLKINTAAIESKYPKYYESTGQLKNISYTSMTYTLYIYKDSGYIFKFVKEETFTATHPGTGFDISTTLNETQDFSMFNENIELTPPKGN